MSNNKESFIKLALKYKALKFGSFQLKSGRVSPYFFNAGAFNSGEALAELGRHYADMIMEEKLEFDMLFGPAYKGIPLVTATVTALYHYYDKSYPWSFNRKEAKDHGEGGKIVGAEITGNILLVDDVMTAGTAIRESIDIINEVGAKAAAVVLMLDREERGVSELSAVQEMNKNFGLVVNSIINMSNLITYLENTGDQQVLSDMKRYRDQYGI